MKKGNGMTETKKHNHPKHIHCSDRACPAFEFEPPFDMPETPAEAVAVIAAWGDEGTMTFSARRAKRCAELLSEHLSTPG